MKLKYILLALLIAVFISGCSCNCGAEIETLQVYFNNGDNGILNTFDNSLSVKDNNGEIIKNNISLSNDEKRAVAELAGEYKFFSLPDTIQTIEEDSDLRELRIKVGVLDKKVIWYEPAGSTEEGLSIDKVAEGIQNMLQSNKDYKEAMTGLVKGK